MTEERKLEIVEAYKRRGTYQKVQEETGYCFTTIWRVLKEYNAGKGRGGNQDTQRKVTDEQILEDIALGLTRHEIAEKRGVHVENLARRMKKLGVHAVYHKPEVIKKKAEWHYIESQAVLFEERQPGFRYVGYLSKRVRLQCKTCGTVIERAPATIRYKNVECEVCKENKNAEVVRIKALQRKTELRKPKICKECGEVFYSEYSDKIYCSAKCKKKKNARGSGYRDRCRKYGVEYNAGITRKAVIERDGNVCKICGKTCNENDRRWGTLGPDFPTVDHIIPLAAGGAHSWNNVQCACASCNSYKRDLIPAHHERGVKSWI